jgi:3-methyladenine DNA glycosylase AlkD
VDVRKVARALDRELKAIGTPERAEGEKRYLKSDLDFYGATLAQIRASAKEAFAPIRAHEDLMALAEELWSKPVFERRMAASIGLELNRDLLTARDLKVLERFLRESKTWALVDWIAVKTTGSIVERFPSAVKTTDRWARDEDFWIRRSAILSQHDPLRDGRSFDAFTRYADPMLEETEFFIRKAIGWVLRDTSKKRPDEVWAWIAPRAHRASGVTMREVVRYLGDERADALMQAYKTRSPMPAKARRSLSTSSSTRN